jgi:hypothetical protein
MNHSDLTTNVLFIQPFPSHFKALFSQLENKATYVCVLWYILFLSKIKEGFNSIVYSMTCVIISREFFSDNHCWYQSIV